jgi:hypothetical protein
MSLTLDHLVAILKQNVFFEEYERREPEPGPEPEERTLTVLKLTELFGLTGAEIKVFEIIY